MVSASRAGEIRRDRRRRPGADARTAPTWRTASSGVTSSGVGDVVEVLSPAMLRRTPVGERSCSTSAPGWRWSYRIVHAVCDAAGRPRDVTFIDMPETLNGQYQHFTQAATGKLRAAGYRGQFTPLEEGIRRYVQDHLTADPYAYDPPPAVPPSSGPVIVVIWYAYIAGLVLGWRLLRRLVRQAPAVATAVQADDFLTWATLGVVLGGLGYVLFYQPGTYLAHPAMILAVWEGGMSFWRAGWSPWSGSAGAMHSVAGFRRSGLRRSGWAGATTSSTANCGGARRRSRCPGR